MLIRGGGDQSANPAINRQPVLSTEQQLSYTDVTYQSLIFSLVQKKIMADLQYDKCFKQCLIFAGSDMMVPEGRQIKLLNVGNQLMLWEKVTLSGLYSCQTISATSTVHRQIQ